MNIIDSVKNEIMFLNEKYIMEAEDQYNFWEEHVKYVVLEALDLAGKYNADKEIVELAAILHDVALIAKIGTRQDHHTTGAELTQTILSKYNYPQHKIDIVKRCVLNHRSSKALTNIEDICVADADVLAHFDNVPMLFNVILNGVGHKEDVKNITLSELRIKMKKSFDHDYNDLSERTKQDFNDRYSLICHIVLSL